MPSYKKKATYRDYGKLIQWQISPIFPTQFWPPCFVRGMRLPLYKEGFEELSQT